MALFLGDEMKNLLIALISVTGLGCAAEPGVTIEYLGEGGETATRVVTLATIDADLAAARFTIDGESSRDAASLFTASELAVDEEVSVSRTDRVFAFEGTMLEWSADFRSAELIDEDGAREEIRILDAPIELTEAHLAWLTLDELGVDVLAGVLEEEPDGKADRTPFNLDPRKFARTSSFAYAPCDSPTGTTWSSTVTRVRLARTCTSSSGRKIRMSRNLVYEGRSVGGLFVPNSCRVKISNLGSTRTTITRSRSGRCHTPSPGPPRG